MENKLIAISKLGQEEIVLNKLEDSIYLIDKSVNIKVINGINVKVIDTLNDGNVSIDVEEGSSVDYYSISTKNTNKSFNVDGEIRFIGISLDKTDEKFEVSLNKENSSFNLKLLSIAKNLKSNYYFNVIHNNKYTFSNIENVGVAKDNGSINFEVIGKINKGMAKSRCSQISRGVVMDDDSEVLAKPILLIDEFDCFANHGAAIGKISDENLFYMMSRGLTKDESVLLILQGMINPYVDNIPLERFKDELKNRLNLLIER